MFTLQIPNNGDKERLTFLRNEYLMNTASSNNFFFVVWNKYRTFAVKLLYNKVLEKDDYTFKPCYPIRQESSIQGR